MDTSYEFRVAGRLGPVLRSALADLSPSVEQRQTILSGTVADREELCRLLARLRELRLDAVDIRLAPGESEAADRRAGCHQVGGVDPGVGEREAAGAGDRTAQGDGPSVLDERDRGGRAGRNGVGNHPGLATA